MCERLIDDDEGHDLPERCCVALCEFESFDRDDFPRKCEQCGGLLCGYHGVLAGTEDCQYFYCYQCFRHLPEEGEE